MSDVRKPDSRSPENHPDMNPVRAHVPEMTISSDCKPPARKRPLSVPVRRQDAIASCGACAGTARRSFVFDWTGPSTPQLGQVGAVGSTHFWQARQLWRGIAAP